MNGFIFGFHRLVWWPKCAPASSRSLIVTEVKRKSPSSLAWLLMSTALPLTLRELEALAGALLAVLLALLCARVPREEPRGTEPLAEFRVPLEQGARETVADGAGLSGNPSA